MTPYEKELFRWLEVTSFGLELKEKYADLPVMVVRSADFFASSDVVERIAEFCECRLPAHFEPMLRRIVPPNSTAKQGVSETNGATL